jgi:hypothetical protein
MTRNKLEKLAQEAGWSGLYIHWAEPDNKPDWRPFKTSLTVPVTMEQIERFAALVAAHEREECAKVCEEQQNMVLMKHPARIEVEQSTQNMMALKCAGVIRARGQE